MLYKYTRLALPRLDLLIGLPILSQCTNAKGESIYCPTPFKLKVISPIQLVAIGLFCGFLVVVAVVAIVVVMRDVELPLRLASFFFLFVCLFFSQSPVHSAW